MKNCIEDIVVRVDEEGNISISDDESLIKLIIGTGEEPTKQQKGGPIKKKKRRHKKPKSQTFSRALSLWLWWKWKITR